MDPGLLVRGTLAVVAGYLIGGIPWGIVVSRVVGGPDPRTIGSGRTGGANVARALGARLALIAGLLDVAKGAVAVLVARLLGAGEGWEIVAALASVLGHSRSPYIGFGGGRGVAPAFGTLLVIQPIVAFVTVPVFLGILVATQYSSVASLSASALAGGLVAISVVLGHPAPLYLAYAAGGTGLVWLFHHDNIRRLLTGQERKLVLRR